jgi:hypothetical protein
MRFHSGEGLRGDTGRPVLYLDIDDTLLTWAAGYPAAARGAREFVVWALERFQIRWLSTWCPTGEMPDSLLHDLARMLDVDPARLRSIRSFDWDATESKLNGIAWLEHVVLNRPFLWVEDEYGVGDAERQFLASHGFLSAYRHCNVTKDADSLIRLHHTLMRSF